LATVYRIHPTIFAMKFSNTLLSFAMLLFSTFVTALPVTDDNDDVFSTTTTESGTLITTSSGFQYLSLRDDFDPTHPALNTTYILSLLGTNATLPRLPGVPYSNITLQSQSSGATKCETSGGSPSVSDINAVYEQLVKLSNANVYCCHKTKGEFCSPLWWKGEAISGLCNFKKKGANVCVKCGVAAAAVKDVMDKCAKDGKAGGYVR
jgi:hypothetical protein